jgi:hypothetical protein
MRDCEHCKQEVVPSPTAPILVHVRDPEFIGPDRIEISFCSWPCLAMWANEQAGEPDARFGFGFFPRPNTR